MREPSPAGPLLLSRFGNGRAKLPMEIIAHRGASLDAPEHTRAAYDLALAQGADMLEVDLRCTADGRLVALHDATLWRTAGDGRAIEDVTLDDLRELPPGRRPLRLGGLLRDYATRSRLLLELKDPAPPMERRVVAVLDRHAARGAVEIQSFQENGLRRVRRIAPDVPVSVLWLKAPRRPAAALDGLAELGAHAIGVHRRFVSAELVRAASLRGIAVRAWTVNDPAEARALAAIGVSGIITDAPGRIAQALADLALPLAA